MSKLPAGMASRILMAMAAHSLLNGAPSDLLLRLPVRQPRPAGYGVHLTKAERKGKTVAELQRLRAERSTP